MAARALRRASMTHSRPEQIQTSRLHLGAEPHSLAAPDPQILDSGKPIVFAHRSLGDSMIFIAAIRGIRHQLVRSQTSDFGVNNDGNQRLTIVVTSRLDLHVEIHGLL